MTEDDIVTSTIKVRLKPWTVPMFAARKDYGEGSEAGSIPVGELDDDALEDMALAWVRRLYLNAGRRHCPFYKSPKAAPQ